MPIRIGFVGTGGIANAHFNTLSQIEDAQPVAFCDVVLAKAETAARRFEGRAYSDVPSMLEHEKLDAVYVCVPPFAHKDAEILCAKAGCALFVEKPVALSVKVGEKIAQAIEDAGVLSAVGYHFRFYGATERLQKLLSAKGAAKPSLCYGRWMGGFPGVPWWRKMEMSGGQLVEQTTHVIDLARYLMGDIVKVYCAASMREMHQQFEGSNVPDVTTLTVEFASGAVGCFATTPMIAGIDVTGLDLVAPGVYYELKRQTLTVKQKGESHDFAHSSNAVLEEDKAFVKAVQTGRKTPIRSDYQDALKTLRVTLAANQSAKSGKAVVV